MKVYRDITGGLLSVQVNNLSLYIPVSNKHDNTPNCKSYIIFWHLNFL